MAKQRLQNVEMGALVSFGIYGTPDTKNTRKRACLLLFIAECPLLCKYFYVR